MAVLWQSGGVRMTDITLMDKALKITWVPRLISSDACWVDIITSKFTIHPKFLFHGNLKWKDFSKYVKNLPHFWEQVCQYWCETTFVSAANTPQEAIASQLVWLNSNIRVNSQVLFSEELFFIVPNILCFVHATMCFLTVAEWNTTYDCQWTEQDFLKIVHAIPANWTLALFHDVNVAKFMQKNLLDELRVLPSKQAAFVYKHMLSAKLTISTCIAKWKIDLDNEDIQPHWNLAIIHVKKIIPNNLHSIQFKFLHCLYSGNWALTRAGLVSSPACKYCSLDKTFFHMFWDCQEISEFWMSLWAWVCKYIPEEDDFDAMHILFGLFLQYTHILYLLSALAKKEIICAR